MINGKVETNSHNSRIAVKVQKYSYSRMIARKTKKETKVLIIQQDLFESKKYTYKCILGRGKKETKVFLRKQHNCWESRKHSSSSMINSKIRRNQRSNKIAGLLEKLIFFVYSSMIARKRRRKVIRQQGGSESRKVIVQQHNC